MAATELVTYARCCAFGRLRASELTSIACVRLPVPSKMLGPCTCLGQASSAPLEVGLATAANGLWFSCIGSTIAALDVRPGLYQLSSRIAAVPNSQATPTAGWKQNLEGVKWMSRS